MRNNSGKGLAFGRLLLASAALVLLGGCHLWPFARHHKAASAPGSPAFGHADKAFPAPPKAAPAAPVSALAGALDCVRTKEGTLLGAHRGRPGPEFHENALSAFRASAGLGVPVLEIDIARTRDNALVLMHDDRVDRTTDGQGRVADLDFSAFRTLKFTPLDQAGMGETPPSFDQALTWAAGRAVLELDRKKPAQWWDILNAVKRAGATDRVIAVSYTLEEAVEIARIDPSVMISVEIKTIADLDALVAAGLTSKRLIAWTGTAAANPGLWQALADRGVESVIGTLGRPGQSLDSYYLADADPSEFADLAAQGVTAIVSDQAARVKPAIQTRLAIARQCLSGVLGASRD